MSFPVPSLKVIAEALAQGLNGTALPDGKILTAAFKPDDIDKVSDGQLPYLLLDPGSLQFTPWKAWERSVSWDVQAVLKVKAEPGEADAKALGIIDALLLRTIEITGLPVDEDGQIVPYTQETARKFDQGKLRFLAERGAPYLSRAQVGASVGAYVKVSLTFHIESTFDLDPRILPIARKAVLGIDPVPPGQIFQDATLPDYVGVALIPPSDTVAWGGYNTSSPTGREDARQRTKHAAGLEYRDQVKQVNVTPYTAALSAGSPTQQLTAIATKGNWESTTITGLAVWATSNSGVATVDSSGLVTFVAAGTASITCTFGGVASNAVAVTCS